jgi:beta-lactamase class A
VAAYERLADVTHYAASTMKVAVLAALYRAGAAGVVDLDAAVPVRNDFESAKPGAPRFAIAHGEDQDDRVWDRVGGTATLRWLARHMIVRSSNLATNVVLSHVTAEDIQTVLRLAGTTRMTVNRGIEDAAAREAGLDNVVTARDLSALMGAIATGISVAAPSVAASSVAAPADRAAMLELLAAQEHREDLAAGLPPGTRVAHKNGWVSGVRHATGVVFPDDAAPYAITVATTGTAPDREACALIARIAAASWADRHEYADGGRLG